MCSACSAASSGLSANFTPPAFMRPPVRTWDLMTVGPPISWAMRRASSGEVAKPWGETGMPALATIFRDSYSKNLMGGGSLSWAPMRLVLALIVLLAAPASAAADVTLTDQSGGGVSYGANQKVTGRVTDAAGAPVANASVRLEAKAFPYAGRFKPVGTAKTAATGRFTFSHAFARNARLRAVVAASGETSPV